FILPLSLDNHNNRITIFYLWIPEKIATRYVFWWHDFPHPNILFLNWLEYFHRFCAPNCTSYLRSYKEKINSHYNRLSIGSVFLCAIDITNVTQFVQRTRLTLPFHLYCNYIHSFLHSLFLMLIYPIYQSSYNFSRKVSLC